MNALTSCETLLTWHDVTSRRTESSVRILVWLHMLILNISQTIQLCVWNLMTLVIHHILDFCSVISFTEGQIQVLSVVQRGYLHHVHRGTIFCLRQPYIDNVLFILYR